MIWSFDEVMKKLGDEAQVTAGGIIVLQRFDDETKAPKHIKVGFFNGMAFQLTPEGLDFLEPNIEDAVIVSETKKVKAAPKKKAAALPEPEEKTEPESDDDDFDFPE